MFTLNQASKGLKVEGGVGGGYVNLEDYVTKDLLTEELSSQSAVFDEKLTNYTTVSQVDIKLTPYVTNNDLTKTLSNYPQYTVTQAIQNDLDTAEQQIDSLVNNTYTKTQVDSRLSNHIHSVVNVDDKYKLDTSNNDLHIKDSTDTTIASYTNTNQQWTFNGNIACNDVIVGGEGIGGGGTVINEVIIPEFIFSHSDSVVEADGSFATVDWTITCTNYETFPHFNKNGPVIWFNYYITFETSENSWYNNHAFIKYADGVFASNNGAERITFEVINPRYEGSTFKFISKAIAAQDKVIKSMTCVDRPYVYDGVTETLTQKCSTFDGILKSNNIKPDNESRLTAAESLLSGIQSTEEEFDPVFVTTYDDPVIAEDGMTAKRNFTITCSNSTVFPQFRDNWPYSIRIQYKVHFNDGTQGNYENQSSFKTVNGVFSPISYSADSVYFALEDPVYEGNTFKFVHKTISHRTKIVTGFSFNDPPRPFGNSTEKVKKSNLILNGTLVSDNLKADNETRLVAVESRFNNNNLTVSSINGLNIPTLSHTQTPPCFVVWHSDGGTEVGSYLDFHLKGQHGLDYSKRFSLLDNGNFYCQNTSITADNIKTDNETRLVAVESKVTALESSGSTPTNAILYNEKYETGINPTFRITEAWTAGPNWALDGNTFSNSIVVYCEGCNFPRLDQSEGIKLRMYFQVITQIFGDQTTYDFDKSHTEQCISYKNGSFRTEGQPSEGFTFEITYSQFYDTEWHLAYVITANNDRWVHSVNKLSDSEMDTSGFVWSTPVYKTITIEAPNLKPDNETRLAALETLVQQLTSRIAALE